MIDVILLLQITHKWRWNANQEE